MSKHVVVIASGETERRSLPYLVAHLRADDISVDEVRIPPRGRPLEVEMAEKLVKATWYQRIADPPDKFVLLVDADGGDPGEVLRRFQEELPRRLGPKIQATIQYAYAQWHLEAWYFADFVGLRKYLGRDPGHVDTSQPDDIQNPKLHLKHLLADRVYTPLVSEEIARQLIGQTIAQRSPSFQGFIDAVRNGQRSPGS